MSNKLRPRQYADARGAIVEAFDASGSCIIAEGATVPADGTAGYAPGGLFFKRSGAVGANLYVNEGSATSCAFKALPDQTTPSPSTAVAGVAAGYKLARGVTALGGSNPTAVTTGLSTVVAATVTLEGTAAPGVGTSLLTIASTNYATGALAVYAWKVTSNANPTLIASTGTENFEWVAVGT